MWDLSLPDWEARIRAGQPLVPKLALNETEADLALRIFDELQLPDVPELPYMRDAAGDWFRILVRVAFGSWDPERRQRYIRDILAMLPKGQSKTTYSSGFCVTCLVMNKRPMAEALFVAPSHAIAENAYDKAVGMIEASADLKRRFLTRDHIKTIEDRANGSVLRVKTFDVKILTGAILILALLDELHLLGQNVHAAKVLRQIRGGLEKTPEGLLLITTTQSDSAPAGVWKDELVQARKIRDGKMRGKPHRPTLPMLYEFPEEIARDPAQWQDPSNWWMVMPNLGRSVHLESLTADWETERQKGEHSVRIWASQHLNIEIGIGLKTDAWPGAEFWEAAVDETLTRQTLIERSEVVVVGCDGGGLDDLFGVSMLGREEGTKTWLAWSTAWAHRSVLERRQSIATRLCDFAKADVVDGAIIERPLEHGQVRDMAIIDDELIDISEEVADLLTDSDVPVVVPKDVAGIVLLIADVMRAGKLASVALDMEGPYGELVDALALIGVTQEAGLISGIGQGYKLMHAIKGMERKLANRTMRVAPSAMMSWCVGNIKIEPTATAIRATKQNAGDAKIDPAMAMFDAGSIMQMNPVANFAGLFSSSYDVPVWA